MSHFERNDSGVEKSSLFFREAETLYGRFLTLHRNSRDSKWHFLSSLHPLYVLPEDIEFDIDRTRYTEGSDIGYYPGVWYEWYREGVISGSDDGEAYAIECYTSLLYDEIAILVIEVYPHKVWVILVACYLYHSSDCIYVPCDEVSIDASLSSDTSLDIECVPNFFATKIGTRKTLLHSKECITLRSDIGKSHTDSIVCDALSDSEWLIVEVILHDKVATFPGDDTRCAFDNSGEQEE